MFRRYCAGQMTPQSRIIGAARADMDAVAFRAMVAGAIKEFGDVQPENAKRLDDFLACVDYIAIDAKGETGWAALQERMAGENRAEAYYFSVSPTLFGDLAERLQKWGMADRQARIVVEKPFGHDLETAQALNATLAAFFWARKRCRT